MKFFAVVLFALNICVVYCRMTNLVKAYKVECNISEKFIVNGTCSLRPVNRQDSAFSFYGYLKQPLDNFVGTLKVFRRYNTFVPFPVSLKINPCDYLSGRKTSILFSIGKVFLDRFTNLNHSCPYTGELIAKNIVFIPEALGNLTSIMPEGIYRVDINTYKGTEDNFIASGSAYFEVKEIDTDLI